MDSAASPPVIRLGLLGLLSGLLLWASYFPFDLGPLAYVALVPLLPVVVEPMSRRKRFFGVTVFGLSFFVLALKWIRVAHPMMALAWIGLAIYCTVVLLGSVYLTRMLMRRGVAWWVALPLCWVAGEYFRCHFPTGFPWLGGWYHPVGFGWYFLGHTQHASEWVRVSAAWGGVYAISLLVLAVNCAAAIGLSRLGPVRNGARLSRIPATAGARPSFVAAWLTGVFAAYYALTPAPQATDRVSLALIQTNIPQAVKIDRTEEMRQGVQRMGFEASRPADGVAPAAIIFPETTWPEDWYELGAAADTPRNRIQLANDRREHFSKPMQSWGVPALLGLNAVTVRGDRSREMGNAAMLFTADGATPERYDKIHLVPFGEFVPFKDSMPFMKMFSPYDHEYGCEPGKTQTLFTLPRPNGKSVRFGVLICYEDTDPGLARGFFRGEKDRPHFLVNTSNDGWFDGTEEHEEHFANCRFRAVELGLPVVRAVNMGISGLIGPRGEVLALPSSDWGSSKKIEAVVRCEVPISTPEPTVYARFGDWLPVGCVFFAACIVLFRRRHGGPV